MSKRLSPLLIGVALLMAQPLHAKNLHGTVVRIIDGDSIVLRTASANELEIRLSGIDAPEFDQPYGGKAKRQLRRLLRSKKVAVTVTGTDRYNRILGCPILNGTDICLEMVRTGAAWLYVRKTKDPDLLAAQQAARQEQLGLWALPIEQALPPWQWRDRTRSGRVPNGRTQKSAPPGCAIKGNINAEGVRIYHLPSQRHYQKTMVSQAKGERWFCSEAEARAAGWRKARR